MLTDDDLTTWIAGLDDLFVRVASRFYRVEPRRRARAYVRGLLAPLADKNGWTLAEAAGDATPDGMQRLLNAATRDDLRVCRSKSHRAWSDAQGRRRDHGALVLVID